MIHMIVAINTTRTIGHHDTIPFHNPEDLAHFKAKTLNHVCVMGRVTYESIPKKLNNRIIWVLTSQEDYKPMHDNVIVFNNELELVDAVLSYESDVYICGGLQIYRLFFPYVSVLWLSHIKDEFDGDVKLDRFEEHMELINTVQYDTFMCEEYHR